MAVRRIVLVLLVVLAQQVLAVVVAVGRAHDGVDVVRVPGTRGPAQRDGRLVIELDQDDRAMDAVVEDARPGPVPPIHAK